MAAFCCSVCRNAAWDRRLVRGDGQGVIFCSVCGMGVLENAPASTHHFYADGYYGGTVGHDKAIGPHYDDYNLTAEHTLLWPRLMVEAIRPRGGRILDVGCANGFLLRRLNSCFELFGIEVNAVAASEAASHDIAIIGSDIVDPRVISSEPFDVVTALAVLEHILDIRAAVATCLRVLKPAGCLIYEVPLISDVSDNKDWLNGSYEHIYYPTERGLRALFDSFGDVLHAGFETQIRGFSASFIGIAALDTKTFEQAAHLLNAMKQHDLIDLDATERRLNVAYHLVHGFRPTPERVLAVPELLEVASSPGLLRRLSELWREDCTLAQQTSDIGRESRK